MTRRPDSFGVRLPPGQPVNAADHLQPRRTGYELHEGPDPPAHPRKSLADMAAAAAGHALYDQLRRQIAAGDTAAADATRRDIAALPQDLRTSIEYQRRSAQPKCAGR